MEYECLKRKTTERGWKLDHLLPRKQLSSDFQTGHMTGTVDELDFSGLTISEGPEVQLQFHSGSDTVSVPKSQGIAEDIGSCSTKNSKSAYLPFPVLFAAISNRISLSKMNLITRLYEAFRSKKMNRDEFVLKLRVVAGDELLKSAIINLQNQNCSVTAEGCSGSAP
ncbi:hypothetical protein POM88_034350 [Heracleum sosnowskyi]|uniref:RST domain-containing protein n=1 Tax=Heracleum sosnowskyi TaxID=360622 RepID=A0AAD8HK74_9APIA|nr:hypothetical protein POM88_034350 [Heracleum sosnowskyi]